MHFECLMSRRSILSPKSLQVDTMLPCVSNTNLLSFISVSSVRN